MTPLPPDSTARLKVFYTVCGHVHTHQVRFKAPNTADDAMASFNDLITAVGGLLFASEVINVVVAADGSNVFNPYAGTWPVGWGDGAGAQKDTANMLNFVGRSVDGRRVRADLFGCVVDSSSGIFRATAAGTAIVEAGVTVLNDAEGTYLSINGFQPQWGLYANLGQSAYWRNHIR